ncbi:ribonuclease P protein component [Candidatus Peregrinibacteria bacterium]|nr:ribonuclease P protein component [Candidatus Peregrinibacteria bacterium]
MKLLRLRGRKICDHVLRRGSVWKGTHMTIRFVAGPPRHPAADPKKTGIYLGTVASTKLEKSAVKRNRMRRRCREAFRVTLKEVEKPVTAQLLILPRSSSLTCAFPELVSDVRAFLSVLH